MLLDELSEERRDEMIEGMSQRLQKWGMMTPAMLFTEVFRPLSFIMSQAIHFFAPIGDTLTGHPYMSEAGFLLQDRDNIDRFLDRLEELSRAELKKDDPGDGDGDDGPDGGGGECPDGDGDDDPDGDGDGGPDGDGD
ncbi:MAG: hypothetical protein R6U70_06795, partial [Bacillota bacterium]